MPQPTCQWRTTESLPGKEDVRALERLNETCKSMNLASSPCTQHTSAPRSFTGKQANHCPTLGIWPRSASAPMLFTPLFLFILSI